MKSYIRVFFESDVSVDFDLEEGAKVTAVWRTYLANGVRKVYDFTDIDGDDCFIDPSRITFIGVSTPENRRNNWHRVAEEEIEEEEVKKEYKWT